MATPNYGYEKRQRELAKKQKKEEKLRAKSERKTGHPDEGDETSSAQAPVSGGTPPPSEPSA